MPYAEVSVNSPVAQRKSFSYSVPDGLDLKIGQAVRVPFGPKIAQGIVLELTEYPSVEETREIAGLIDSDPLLSPAHVSLARWISSYYLSPLFDSVALMLPPGYERRIVTFIEKSLGSASIPLDLDLDQKEVLEFIIQNGKFDFRKLEKNFGSRRVGRIVSSLINQNLVEKSYELEKLRIQPKIVSYLSLKVDLKEAVEAVDDLQKRAFRQALLLKYFIDNLQPVAAPDLKQIPGYSPSTLNALLKKGLIQVEKIKLDRDPLANYPVNLSLRLSLTATQNTVFQMISANMKNGPGLSKKVGVFLLRGVTGSGKTEIYLQVLEETLKSGRKGIVLVPEIAMTPQIIERFVARFPGRVAVLHSELTLGEQFDEWWRIKKGEFDVVIGPRSALFTPQPNLGLIILDEEHEWSYKQQDKSPRYHARDVAVKLAALTGATLVLGSATPSVESYFKAVEGEYRLLEMPLRVTPDEGSPLPAVEIVDLREELKSGNLSIFSRSLFSAINDSLNNREQVILFINRRGSASFVECRKCGWLVRCKRCNVPLSYHFNEQKLICHQCNYRLKVPEVCPECGSPKIKYLGAGTEKVEQETLKSFPHARVLRWDSDIIKERKISHQTIYNKFKNQEADILIGTQMIAKGLDLPRVTLVGVVSADIALNLPDFRAGERVFHLLSQVAGRSGRGSAGGKVIIQTYSPEHYAIQSAARHDYPGFYNKEIAYRRELHNPPYSRLARLVFSHTTEIRCQEETQRMKQLLLQKRDMQGIAGISLIGPAPAFISRLRKKYRWQLILRSADPSGFLSGVLFSRGWSVDIDPVGLL